MEETREQLEARIEYLQKELMRVQGEKTKLVFAYNDIRRELKLMLERITENAKINY